MRGSLLAQAASQAPDRPVQEMLTDFRAGNLKHMPALKELLEKRCAGARIKALTAELGMETAFAFN